MVATPVLNVATGKTRTRVNEKLLLRQSTPYGADKGEAEKYLGSLSRAVARGKREGVG